MRADVIDIKDHLAQAKLEVLRAKTATELRLTAEHFFGAAINLAVLGPLKAWNDSQPVGALAQFSAELLTGTGDPDVLALLDVVERCRATADRLEQES